MPRTTSPPPEPTFAARLVVFRERNGWSQSRTASVLGINLRTLQNWEQGRNIPKGFALASLNRIINSTA